MRGGSRGLVVCIVCSCFCLLACLLLDIVFLQVTFSRICSYRESEQIVKCTILTKKVAIS